VVDDLAAIDVEPSEERLVEQAADGFVVVCVGSLWLVEEGECGLEDVAASVGLAVGAFEGGFDLGTFGP